MIAAMLRFVRAIRARTSVDYRAHPEYNWVSLQVRGGPFIVSWMVSKWHAHFQWSVHYGTPPDGPW